MIFFQPTKKWIDWLVGYAHNRIIVDIGCGEGELLKQLYANGYDRLVGVDMYIRDELRIHFHKMGTPVHLWEFNTIDNSILKELTDKCLFLFCRPCHGGFVELTLPNLPAEAEVLYIGKPDNLDLDIPLCNYRATTLKTPRLREEMTYQIARIGKGA